MQIQTNNVLRKRKICLDKNELSDNSCTSLNCVKKPKVGTLG